MAMAGASDPAAASDQVESGEAVEAGVVESHENKPPTRARGAPEIEAPVALRPLGPHERPPALRVASATALACAIAVLVGAATVRDLSRHGGSLPAGIFLAGVLLALAWGMHRRRYWAVLGFEALLAFQIIVTSLALVVADTLLAAALCALSVGLAGWLFWKLVRVMGRIQAGERETDEALR
jgi:uncharacterized protein (TIGR03382 family)